MMNYMSSTNQSCRLKDGSVIGNKIYKAIIDRGSMVNVILESTQERIGMPTLILSHYMLTFKNRIDRDN